MQGLFNTFCHYVDETIFSKENMGETVVFIIDQAYIDEFCKKYSVKEETLMQEVRLNLYKWKYDQLQIKGILAIQLYAATKREDSGGITEKNYRDRLSQVLKWDIIDLQSWMADYQESYWNELYKWCQKNNFHIAKCYPKTGAGRYVQYPIQQAARVFTQKDLKYIAYHFVQLGLRPNEDLSENDFWKILNKRNIRSYVHTNHARRLVEHYDYLDDAYAQIFNYYLRWDGSYLDLYREKTERIQPEKHFLYLSEDGYVDIRDINFRREERIYWRDLDLNSLEDYYTLKREEDKTIIFRRSEDYEGYWVETRYLEDKEDGIAIIFRDRAYYHYGISTTPVYFYGLTPIFTSSHIKIYQFSYNERTESLYAEKKYFSLEGGLKIGRQQYMEGGAPILTLEKESIFWIDGEEPRVKPRNGILPLNFLNIGDHDIKFPKYKKIQFSIVKAKPEIMNWNPDYNKWILHKDSTSWNSACEGSGVVGIDFTCYRMTNSFKTSKNTLRRWAEFHSTGKTIKNENNIALRLLMKK